MIRLVIIDVHIFSLLAGKIENPYVISILQIKTIINRFVAQEEG
ncbi:hypothetical protein DSBG_1204 [Desulfosporosinus sp. BG]|nr:hypothetical protein DSBG_1204 [Desulfosporosinus sp. BG]